MINSVVSYSHPVPGSNSLILRICGVVVIPVWLKVNHISPAELFVSGDIERGIKSVPSHSLISN